MPCSGARSGACTQVPRQIPKTQQSGVEPAPTRPLLLLVPSVQGTRATACWVLGALTWPWENGCPCWRVPGDCWPLRSSGPQSEPKQGLSPVVLSGSVCRLNPRCLSLARPCIALRCRQFSPADRLFATGREILILFARTRRRRPERASSGPPRLLACCFWGWAGPLLHSFPSPEFQIEVIPCIALL